MKKLWLVLGMGILGFAISVNGTIWRVNNGIGTAADFSTPAQAVASASVAEGDTLLVEGSPITYGALTVTKQLKIIGPGYFLNENIGLQASPAVARFTNITFGANSEGSLISSVYVDVTIFLYRGSITVTRCRTSNLYVGYSLSGGAPSPNSVVSRNYITGRLYIQRATSDNAMISNNFIGLGISASGTGSHTLRNNVIGGGGSNFDLTIDFSTFINNIVIAGSTSPRVDNNIYRFNIGHGDQFGTANGNQVNVSFPTNFVGPGTTDGQWQIDASGPAKDAGENGADIGMFGGAEPYVLSGIPPIPTITEVTVPAFGSITGGLDIRVKGQANQ